MKDMALGGSGTVSASTFNGRTIEAARLSAPSWPEGSGPDSEPRASDVLEHRIPWCCPLCRGPLDVSERGASCLGCGQQYGRVGPMLDLRAPAPGYDFTEDTQRARRLWNRAASCGAERFIRQVFSERCNTIGFRGSPPAAIRIAPKEAATPVDFIGARRGVKHE